MNHVVNTTSKDLDSLLSALPQVINWYDKYNCKVLKIRCDAENVMQSQSIIDYCNSCSITLQSSIPYCHWQNSVERDVQTIVKGTSTLLHSQPWLRADVWDLALNHFISIRNRTPNSHHARLSPYQRITKRPLDLNTSFKFSFGDFVAVSIPDHQRTFKFDIKNDIGIYVGQCDNMKSSCLIYWPFTHKTSCRYDCTKLELSDAQLLHYHSRRALMKEKPLPYNVFSSAIHDFRDSLSNIDKSIEILKPSSVSLFDTNLPTSIPTTRTLRSSFNISDSHQSAYTFNVSDATNSIRDDDINIGSFMEDRYCAYSAKVTVTSALKSQESEHWIKAIKKEIELMFSSTTLVPEPLPTNSPYHIINSTAQLKRKLHQDGTISTYKARLCACGNELKEYITETYSPTISALAYSAIHQISIIDKMFMHTIDTVGAYLYEYYPKDATPIYLTLPKHIALTCGLDPSATYRINKYLYGLPDSGRAYYRAYSAHIIKHGYTKSISDPCLFYKVTDTIRIYIWIHVDDTFIASKYIVDLNVFESCLRLKYEITVNTNVNEYLGICMTYLPDGNVKLTQPKLLSSIFNEYREYITEFDKDALITPQRSSKSKANTDTTPKDQFAYLHLLGALIYMTKSRPDIATAVSFGAVHASHPSVGDFNTLMECVQYLYHTQHQGLILHTGTPGAPLTLTCYVDASYLTHEDSKSHSGYCLSFGKIGCFYSKSSKQSLVTTSTTHSEIRSIYSATIDIIFLIHLTNEISRPIELPAIMMEDNLPSIQLSTDPHIRTKRCKHFLMLIDYIGEQVQCGYIKLTKIDTKDNVADILTKIVTGHNFLEKAQRLLGINSSS